VGIRYDANQHSFHHGSIVREGDNYLPGDWVSSGREQPLASERRDKPGASLPQQETPENSEVM
jgi:hypothetical protein